MQLTWLLAGIFGTIGGYIPVLWGGSGFSFASILLSTVGGIFGIWLGFKLTH